MPEHSLFYLDQKLGEITVIVLDGHCFSAKAVFSVGTTGEVGRVIAPETLFAGSLGGSTCLVLPPPKRITGITSETLMICRQYICNLVCLTHTHTRTHAELLYAPACVSCLTFSSVM